MQSDSPVQCQCGNKSDCPSECKCGCRCNKSNQCITFAESVMNRFPIFGPLGLGISLASIGLCGATSSAGPVFGKMCQTIDLIRHDTFTTPGTLFHRSFLILPSCVMLVSSVTLLFKGSTMIRRSLNQ